MKINRSGTSFCTRIKSGEYPPFTVISISWTPPLSSACRAFFGPKVYETIIPRNIRVAEAPSHGKPILLYDFDCAGSQAYIKLATEIIERERQHKAA